MNVRGLQCIGCSSSILRSKREFFITCNICANVWHDKCADLDDSLVRGIKTEQLNWTCHLCSHSASVTPLDLSMMSSEQVINSNRIGIESNTDINDAINQLKADLSKLETTQQQFGNFLTSFGSNLNNLAGISQRLDEHHNRIAAIEQQNISYKNQMSKLERRMDDLDQKHRAHNLQVDGIPEANQENLRDIILKLASSLNVVITSQDITHVTRVRSTNKEKIKPVICSLSKYNIMADLIKASRIQKPLAVNAGFSNNNNNIYINEHLTVARKQLLYKAKKFKIENNFEFLWVKDGKIYLKKNRDSKAVNINVGTDFSKLN